MLGLVYLAVAVVPGHQICRSFLVLQSPAHRWASAFLVGMLISTWATYLLALAFASTDKPLIWANLLYFIFAGYSALKLWKRTRTNPQPLCIAKLSWLDAFFVCAYLAIACWLMFGTLWLTAGKVGMAFVVWNDFGANLSLVQSFAVGHNFPTEYPHFIGHPIHYHFLFWFQAGNLEFLGLNMAWAVNLLSVLSLVAMLMLMMTLGEVLFDSRAVGRIGASLFLFPTTLSYLPFLRSQGTFSRALEAVTQLRHWLSSGYPYRGEDWGIWSLGIYYVQRRQRRRGNAPFACLRKTPESGCAWRGEEKWQEIQRPSFIVG